MGHTFFAKHHNIDLDIIQGADNINPVQLVASGAALFGDASADAVMLANQKGANLVILGVISYDNPTVFLSKTKLNITTPKDLEGHTVGILPGTNTEYVYRTMIAKNHVNEHRIKEVNVDFDLRPFIVTNEYDVRPAYVYDEEVTLDEARIAYNVIDPRQWGVRFMGTVYFAKEDTVVNNPQLVHDFICTVADGWRAVIEHQDDAVTQLLEYDPTMKRDHTAKSLAKAIPYIMGQHGHVLWAEPSDWVSTVESLKQLHVLDADFDISRYLHMEFLEQYYREEGTPSPSAGNK
jgi:NitT/TauT family transport system substrate-binding protein